MRIWFGSMAMIPYTNDGGRARPRLRTYFNLMALEDLPQESAGPQPGPLEAQLEAIAGAGYEGVQFVEPATLAQLRRCEQLGLGRCGFGRVNRPEDAGRIAVRLAAEGMECGTLHAGWGIEDDNECFALIEAILRASDGNRIPLYVETHRATAFQDMWRTVQFVRRYPELRFNGDFSHWYTGLEMVYGGFENKAAFIAPVLERVAFLHGRIGNPGSMQVDIGEGDAAVHPYVGHFLQLWSAAFAGFRRNASAGDYILFVPELLSPRIYYGRVFGGREECDRWRQSLVLCRLAREAFAAA